MGHLLGASCGYRKPFRVPRSGSRSLQIGPESVRPSIRRSVHISVPTEFFFETILEQRNGAIVEERRKTLRKVILR